MKNLLYTPFHLLLLCVLLLSSCQKEVLERKEYFRENIRLNKQDMEPEFCNLQANIDTWAKEGTVTAFCNDQLRNTIPASDLRKTGMEETVRVYPNPDDPYEYYDSLIVVPFDKCDIQGYSVIYEFTQAAPNSMNDIHILGVGPMWKPMENGEVYPECPVYYASLSELKAVMNQDDYNWLKYYLTASVFDERMRTPLASRED